MKISFALALLTSTVTLSSEVSTPATSISVAPSQVIGPTVRFGDYDGDGLLDAYVVNPTGGDRLLRNLGDGNFADVTRESGLSGIHGSRLALWQDYDRDGALDLFVCSSVGESRLMRNMGSAGFVDVTRETGVAHVAGSDLFAEWIDYDADGRPDLHVVTDRSDEVYHNRGRGRFERANLLAEGTSVTQVLVPTPTGSHSGGTQLAHTCQDTMRDQTTGNCIQANSTPALGMLYPLSSNLFVGATGKVGVGTTSPGANLHVAGVDGLLATGTLGSGTSPASGAGTRLVWYPRKAAFRAGTVDGAQWDDANIGDRSTAMGNSTTASGPMSTAMGASTTAGGSRSTAMGTFTRASGHFSTAMGDSTTANGVISTAMGSNTTASGSRSTAMGDQTDAESYASVALGSWNVGGGSPGFWVPTDPLFEIGNGTSSAARSNAMTVLKSGRVGITTAAPEALLHVLDGSAGTVTAANNASVVFERNMNNYISMLAPATNQTGLIFGDPTDNDSGGIYYSGSAHRMELRTGSNQTRVTITAAGDVGIKRAPASNDLEVEGTASKTAAGDWLANSDRRIKTEIRVVEGALETLDRVRPVVFRYTSEYREAHPSIEDKDYYNVVAQEFAAVFPEYVKPSGEGDLLQVDTYPMQVCAVAAVKELNAQMRERDERIAELEVRLQAQVDRIASLEELTTKLVAAIERVDAARTGDR